MIADAIPQIVWVTDQDGRWKFFNKQWSDYTGVSYEETTATEIAVNHLHPDDAQATIAAFEEARRNGTTFLVEHRIRSAWGDYRWFLVRGEPYRDPDSGDITRWFGTSVDINDRRQVEEALRESAGRLAFLDRLSAETAALSDADAVLARTTSLLGEHLGLSVCAYADMDDDQDGFTIRGDWAAPGSKSIVGHYSLSDFGELAVSRLTAGLPLVVNDNLVELAPHEAATFQSIGISATICMPLVKDGRLTALMAIHDREPRNWTEAELSLLREVTARSWAHVERVATVAALAESEERLRLAVDNAEVGFWDVDHVNDVLIWPARTKAMFGISADVPVTMQDFYDGLHPDDREATAHAYAAAADPERRALYDVEYRTIGKEDGVLRWVAAKGRGVFDASGRCLRVAGTVLDITMRKQAEEALHDLNATLETRIADAVAQREKAQEALRQSQKMEAMGQLTGGVAHDFNNLLTPIVGSLDMLVRRRIGNEREQRLIDGALQSAERAKILVQRLLAFARRQPLQPVAVDLGQLVGGMVGLLTSTLGPNINVRVELDDDLPPANADFNQLEMALLNLAVNARDAMPNGGRLTIAARRERVRDQHVRGLKPGQYVRLSVADSGIGMDEATRERAIEPFFSTKGIGKGTGLGLSMVHGLTAQLGGSLTIDSAIGQGTTIDLWLPLGTAASEDGEETARPSPANVGRGIALLVDDEELVRLSTADMLMDLGFEVREASSAEEALELITGGLMPELLVTDHLMPGMSGVDLAMRAREIRPALPVLVVSGYAEAEGIAPELPRLTKPFRNADLAASIAALGGR
jgi:PAS domain S-box-containing protein